MPGSVRECAHLPCSCSPALAKGEAEQALCTWAPAASLLPGRAPSLPACPWQLLLHARVGVQQSQLGWRLGRLLSVPGLRPTCPGPTCGDVWASVRLTYHAGPIRCKGKPPVVPFFGKLLCVASEASATLGQDGGAPDPPLVPEHSPWLLVGTGGRRPLAVPEGRDGGGPEPGSPDPGVVSTAPSVQERLLPRE